MTNQDTALGPHLRGDPLRILFNGIMQVFLVRHADAVDAADDPERPLSKRGRKQVRDLASFLKKAGAFQPDEFWHSPLARANETAVFLRRRLGSSARLVTVADLESDAGVFRLAACLQKVRRPVALVGHEPHLSALASFLIAGEADPPLFVVKKCAVIALERTGCQWVVRWHVSPEVLQPASGPAPHT